MPGRPSPRVQANKPWGPELILLISLILLALPASASDDKALTGHNSGFQKQTQETRSTAAFKHTKQSAEGGDSTAQYTLGEIYAKGRGIPQNHKQALIWYRKAAEQGHVKAQYMLGMIYTLGLAGYRDYVKAVHWHREAANQGHGHAQLILGKMYAHGFGVSINYVQAYLWLNLASAAAIKGAAQAHELVALSMTGDQLAQAERLSATWWAEHPD